MKFNRMVIEKESPEEFGYDRIKNNLTESSIPDFTLNKLGMRFDLNDLSLAYTDHSGDPALRAEIVKEYPKVSEGNILVVTGAVMALFLVNVTLLSPGDKTLVVHPNYSSNVEVPRSLATDPTFYQLEFDSGYRIDIDEFAQHITPEVKLISITYPHNPTGAMISESDLKRLIAIAEERNCHILVDETYRELTMGKKLPTAASLSPMAISVESMSKSYGLPGIRTGWLATQDSELKEKFLSAKEQIAICNSILDETVAAKALSDKTRLLAETRKMNMEKFHIVKEWMEGQELLEWVEPKGGVVCFPRIKPEIKINPAKFYDTLNNKYGTFVGPGHWFEQPDNYFRIGYSWPEVEQLLDGLASITKSIRESMH